MRGEGQAVTLGCMEGWWWIKELTFLIPTVAGNRPASVIARRRLLSTEKEGQNLGWGKLSHGHVPDLG